MVRLNYKQNWKTVAVDRQGRKHNPRVHGEKPELDKEGYLKVRRREASTAPGATNKTEAFVNKYREPGYTYYVMNDEGGRLEQFQQSDWEPVMTPEGVAKMKVGQARQADTTAILLKKPTEWYEQDQQKKRELREDAQKHKSAPKEGQYEAEASSPLR